MRSWQDGNGCIHKLLIRAISSQDHGGDTYMPDFMNGMAHIAENSSTQRMPKS